MTVAEQAYRETERRIRAHADRIIASIRNINPWADTSEFFTERPMLLAAIEPGDEPQTLPRMRAREALAHVAGWRVEKLARAQREYSEAVRAATAAHKVDHVGAGLGHLPLSDADLRSALKMGADDYLRLMPNALASTLAEMGPYLPANPSERHKSDASQYRRQQKILADARAILAKLSR